MGRDAKDKYKYDVAFTYAKNKLTEFRTEERRKVKYCELALVKLIHFVQVIGLSPYEGKPLLCTSDLGDYLLHCMQPPDDTDVPLYLNHLAILVSKPTISMCASPSSLPDPC